MDDLQNGGAAPAPAESTAAPSTPTTDSPVSTPETTAPSPEVSLDDELSSIWDEAQSADDDEPASSPPARDEKGRFQSSKPPEATLTGDPQDTDPPPAEGEPGTEPPAAPVHRAPPSWSGESKAKVWASLPPEAQEYIAQRESDAHRAITQQGQRLKQFEPFDQLVQQHRDHFERAGVHPAESFSMLLNAQSALESDPVGGLVQIGLSYGIDLRPLLGIEGGLPNSGQDPTVRALQARLQQLEGKLSEHDRAQAQAAEQRAEAERASLQSTIADFAKDKPHFEAVKPTMAALLRSGQAEDLAQAYDMAIHAVPAIRQRILEDQRKADGQTRIADVRRAQRAAAVNTRSLPATATPRSVDDELAAIAAKHYGR